MAMFGFDDQYPYYGATPVDNQFILEYLPGASGDAVRVYLYGLMQCYHPQGMSVEQMAREIGLTVEEIKAAYRHWERKGLVRRIADDPPTYRYVSVRQLTNMGGGAFQVDEDYVAFCEALQGIFGDRKIHGGEQGRCYEWVESMQLPAEAVLCIIRSAVQKNGKRVAIKTIEARVTELAEKGAKTLEDVQELLAQDQAVEDGARAVLRRFGKRRAPSQDEMELYRTWYRDWGFSQEDILAACAETTGGGEPTFKYLGGILNRLNQKRSGKVADVLQGEKEQSAPLKALLNVMHLRSVTVNEATLETYEQMRELYPDAIILMAGQECAKRGAGFEDVMTTLKIWKREGLTTTADVRRYMQHVDDMNDFLRMIYDVLGVQVKPNGPDRRLAEKWLTEYKFDMAFVTQCAAFAIGKEKPMAYLAAMMENYYQKGVTTFEAAQQERAQFLAQQQTAAPQKTGKVVGEQLYTQREYQNDESELETMMKQWKEENGHA